MADKPRPNHPFIALRDQFGAAMYRMPAPQMPETPTTTGRMSFTGEPYDPTAWPPAEAPDSGHDGPIVRVRWVDDPVTDSGPHVTLTGAAPGGSEAPPGSEHWPTVVLRPDDE